MNNSKIDTIEIQSKVLGKAMAMMVYVPADFTEGLPTLYFMHGRNGDEKIIHALDIQAVADKMINAPDTNCLSENGRCFGAKRLRGLFL